MAKLEPSVGGRIHRTNEAWLRGSMDLWPEQELVAVPLEGRQDCGGSNWAGKTMRSVSNVPRSWPERQGRRQLVSEELDSEAGASRSWA